MEKTCLECETAIFGRVDKKFCSDQCRNTYNNRHNSDATNYIRKVNNTLRKNRRILAGLNPEGKATVHRNQLVSKAFDFEYQTSTYTNRKGDTYIYCYDQGYLPLENDYFFLVRNKRAQ